MPVPSVIGDLSVTAASNSPAGSESPNTVDDYLRSHASFLAYLRDGKQFSTEATVASATTCDIGAASSLYVKITGTTTITSFGTDYQGPRFLRFESSLTLTHNALSLILPGGANITTAAGDTAIAVPQSGGWRVASYQRAAGLAGNGPAFSAYQSVAQSIASATLTKIQLQAEEFDTASAFDASTNYRFQPTVAGYYRISGSVGFGTSAVVYASIFKNGAEYKRGAQPADGFLSSVSALVYLNGTTDYVELYGYQGTAGAQNSIANVWATYLQGSFERTA